MLSTFTVINTDAAGAALASVGGIVHMQMADTALVGLLATLVHGAGYLLVTGLIAAIVYEKLGVALLRKAWINLDLVWSIALIGFAPPVTRARLRTSVPVPHPTSSTLSPG